jgi:hypothetical protein
MNILKKIATFATFSVFVLSLMGQVQMDQDSRKKGPPFNDEGPGGSGKRVVSMLGQI